MDTYLDVLDNDCLLMLLPYLDTSDLLRLKKISPRIGDNVLYFWGRQKKFHVCGKMEKGTNTADRIEFWSVISPVVEDLALDCLEAHHIRELQNFTYPKARRLFFASLESMLFNDIQLRRFPLNFPHLETLKLSCLTSASNIWRFQSLTELDCGTFMTPSEGIFKKMFFLMNLRKFQLVYNTYSMSMMHPMIKSIWYSATMETLCVDDWQLCCCALPKVLTMPRLNKIEIYGGDYDGLIMNHLIDDRAHDVYSLLYHKVFRNQQLHHDAWIRMPNLRKLIFVKDRIPTSTIRQMKTQLNLKEFHLENMSKSASAALIELFDWKGLELINLTNTEVSYDYIIQFKEHIKISLRKRYTPVTIYIHKTTLTKNQLNDVVDYHPMVKISTEPLHNCGPTKYKKFFYVYLLPYKGNWNVSRRWYFNAF